MSLSIKYTPTQYSSFQDNLIYTVLSDKVSDPATYPNFKYIGDVYIGGVQVARLKKIADPVTGIGVFDVAQIVRAYCETTFSPTFGQLAAQVLGDTAFNLSVVMKFGEEYDFVEYLNITVDSSRVFFNNYNGRGLALNTSLLLLGDKVASRRPTTGQARLTERYNLVPFFPTTTGVIAITVTPVGGGLGYIDTVIPDNAYDLQIINLAPANLNSFQAGTITEETQYYDVQIGSQTYRFNVVCEAVYTAQNIHFLNKLGGFESKSFNKVSRYSVSSQKSDYGKYPYTIGADGGVTGFDGNNVYNEVRPVYASQFTESKVFNTDLLTDDEYAWLSDLMLSPMVYIEEANGDFFPVRIVDTSYEIRKAVNDGPTNLTINVQYGATLNAQYR